MAQRHGIHLSIEHALDDEGVEKADAYQLFIWDDAEDMEPLAIYNVHEQGFFFRAALTSDIKEEFPHWIESEQHLRNLIRPLKELAQNIH